MTKTLRMKLKEMGKDAKEPFINGYPLTYRELGEILECSKSTISQVNAGKHKMSSRLAKKLAEKFGGDVAYWLDIDPDKLSAKEKLIEAGWKYLPRYDSYQRGTELLKKKTFTVVEYSQDGQGVETFKSFKEAVESQWVYSSKNDPKMRFKDLQEATDTIVK